MTLVAKLAVGLASAAVVSAGEIVIYKKQKEQTTQDTESEDGQPTGVETNIVR